MTEKTHDYQNLRLLTPMLVIGGVVVAICFIVVTWALMDRGHAAFNMNQNVAWGLPISTYVYFALMSSGLTLVSALGLVFGFKQYYPLIKRAIWVSIITLVAGLAVLAVELPGTFRMLFAMPANLQIQSAMFWMGVFYLADLVFMAWKFERMERGDWDSRLSRQLGIASFIAVLLAAGTLALIFGMMSMRPFWFDGLMPVWFYVSGAASGVAALLLFTHLRYAMAPAAMPEAVRTAVQGPLASLFTALLGAGFVLFLARMTTGLYTNNPEVHQVWADYLFASGWFHVGVWGGLLLPLLLTLGRQMRQSPGVQVAAAALVLVGVFIERYFFVVGGQVIPLWKGTWTAGFDAYVPSAMEWVLTVMGIALVFALFGLGERLFNLSDAPSEAARKPATEGLAGENPSDARAEQGHAAGAHE